jgi:hypothetical protein
VPEEVFMSQREREFGRLLSQIKGEYHEMPGLCVNLTQACRLWHLDKDTCSVVLNHLVHDHFLKETSKGLFVRS